MVGGGRATLRWPQDVDVSRTTGVRAAYGSEADPLLLALPQVRGHGPEPGRAVRNAEDGEPDIALARDRPEPGAGLVESLGKRLVLEELDRALDPELLARLPDRRRGRRSRGSTFGFARSCRQTSLVEPVWK